MRWQKYFDMIDNANTTTQDKVLSTKLGIV
jgi:hypothetical protein